MRVLMFGWEFPPYQAGGLATATSGLVKGLLRNGVDVTLVVPFQVEDAGIPGLRLRSTVGAKGRWKRIRVPSPVQAYHTVEQYALQWEETKRGTGGRGNPYGANLFEEIERFAEIAEDIAAEEPHDVIDCHDWITYPAARRAAAVSGRPLVAHLHATERDRSGDGANPEIQRREREGVLAAHRIICNSRMMKRQVVAEYGAVPGRVAVVPWGIDEQVAKADLEVPRPFGDDAPVVLFLGRVTRQKGPEFFVEVARRVADVEPETRFLMVGTGDLLPRIIERTVALGLAERVHFAGGLSGPDVDRAFRMATVCVMPSVSEPFGLVALESLRSGTPCILPRESGVAEVVRHALRADFWDVEQMADQVVGVLRHRVLHRELQRRGAAEVRSPRFSLDEPARGTARVYREAMNVSTGGG